MYYLRDYLQCVLNMYVLLRFMLYVLSMYYWRGIYVVCFEYVNISEVYVICVMYVCNLCMQSLLQSMYAFTSGAYTVHIKNGLAVEVYTIPIYLVFMWYVLSSSYSWGLFGTYCYLLLYLFCMYFYVLAMQYVLIMHILLDSTRCVLIMHLLLGSMRYVSGLMRSIVTPRSGSVSSSCLCCFSSDVALYCTNLHEKKNSTEMLK